MTLEAILYLLVHAKVVEPGPVGDTLVPRVRLDGIDIVTSSALPSGSLVPLGPRSYAISKVDYDKAVKR